MDREPLFGGIEARSAGDGPALHDPVELEAKVVMQPPCGVFLDHVIVAAAGHFAAPRFRRDVKFSFLAVNFERHVNHLARR